jgi:CRISPR-associated protein Cas5d
MKGTAVDLALYVEEERQQRAGLFLRDVAYRLHAALELLPSRVVHKRNHPHLADQTLGFDGTADEQQPVSAHKYRAMFERRAAKGQCVNQPYLGCREFAADVRLVDETSPKTKPIPDTRDLGFMLHDLDFENSQEIVPHFFRAQMDSGVILVPPFFGAEVRQ